MNDAPVTITHLSDLHFTHPGGWSLRTVWGKRLLGYLSWRLKRRHRHRSESLAAAAEDVRAVGSDAIVITGDLTQLGLPRECAQARDWLPCLGDPETVTVVPGNHDAYGRSSWAETLGLWSPWCTSKDDRSAPDDVFPVVREVKDAVSIFGLSSARPTAPFLATGRVGRTQLDRLASGLEEAGRRGRFRIVFLHHPPAAGTVRRRKQLTDLEALGEVLDRCGVELVLHGHAHEARLNFIESGGREVPAIGAPSATEFRPDRGRRPRYNHYAVSRSDDGWRLDVHERAWSDEVDGFAPSSQRTIEIATWAGGAA